MATTTDKPTIIGIYGVPGSGKTHLLNEVKRHLSNDQFKFMDSSDVLNSKELRELTIQMIADDAQIKKKAAVVTGHLMFWNEEIEAAVSVCTPMEKKVYTHILYLDLPPETIAVRRANDITRARPALSLQHLREWQETEKQEALDMCSENSILYRTLAMSKTSTSEVVELLLDLVEHNASHNLGSTTAHLDRIMAVKKDVKTMLVFDADKTLAPFDAGSMFWKKVYAAFGAERTLLGPPKPLFETCGYTYTAFRQATMMYEHVATYLDFEAICAAVAAEIVLYPEIEPILCTAGGAGGHVGVVVVTCGIKRVWELVLGKYGLSETDLVIGGGRLTNGYVVTPAVKAAIVARLQQQYHTYVWAFGNSPLDLEMMVRADQAIVVVGEENNRSKSMDGKLLAAMNDHGLKPHQVLLPKTAKPRLTVTQLPIIDLTHNTILEPIFRQRIFHATDTNANKLLQTPMRDSIISGPAHRQAHHRTANYLTLSILSEVIGVESFSVDQVQGTKAEGWRIRGEGKTTIVALMRGGEPMALGVSDAMPSAMFVQAHEPEELKDHHLAGQKTVILVDSVINAGKSASEFIQHIRKTFPSIRIVVVAGEANAQCVCTGDFAEMIRRDLDLYLVVLRFSENSYTGTKGVKRKSRD